MISSLNAEEYEFTLRETSTYEIIEGVAHFRSEVGVLYFSRFNEKVLNKLLKENHLTFVLLFDAEPHLFISSVHPLSKMKGASLEDLDNYSCLVFEEGAYNSFYFSEESLSTVPHKKTIHVSDRATLFNLLIGLNGYPISTGVLNSDLNADSIVSVKLKTDERVRVGWISNGKVPLSLTALNYVKELKKLIADNGYTILQ